MALLTLCAVNVEAMQLELRENQTDFFSHIVDVAVRPSLWLYRTQRQKFHKLQYVAIDGVSWKQYIYVPYLMLPSLRTLRASGAEDLSDFPYHATGTLRLKDLELSNPSAGDSVYQDLYQVIRSCPALERLILHRVFLDVTALKSTLEALRSTGAPLGELVLLGRWPRLSSPIRSLQHLSHLRKLSIEFEAFFSHPDTAPPLMEKLPASIVELTLWFSRVPPSSSYSLFLCLENLEAACAAGLFPNLVLINIDFYDPSHTGPWLRELSASVEDRFRRADSFQVSGVLFTGSCRKSQDYVRRQRRLDREENRSKASHTNKANPTRHHRARHNETARPTTKLIAVNSNSERNHGIRW